jgi:hypothetical protein
MKKKKLLSRANQFALSAAMSLFLLNGANSIFQLSFSSSDSHTHTHTRAMTGKSSDDALDLPDDS